MPYGVFPAIDALFLSVTLAYMSFRYCMVLGNVGYPLLEFSAALLGHGGVVVSFPHCQCVDIQLLIL